MTKRANYQGEAKEKGGTALAKTAPPSPAIKWLVEKGHIKAGMKVLDYGAGNGRNAEYLRNVIGCRVYAFDPNNANTKGSGYKPGNVTSKKPRGRFDVAFSCYVLNVVRVKDERAICKALESFSDTVFHVVRPEHELVDMADNALRYRERYNSPNKFIYDWYHKRFWQTGGYPSACESTCPVCATDRVFDFCHYGFPTGKDKFQRLVSAHAMRRRGYLALHDIKKYTMYASAWVVSQP